MNATALPSAPNVGADEPLLPSVPSLLTLAVVNESNRPTAVPAFAGAFAAATTICWNPRLSPVIVRSVVAKATRTHAPVGRCEGTQGDPAAAGATRTLGWLACSTPIGSAQFLPLHDTSWLTPVSTVRSTMPGAAPRFLAAVVNATTGPAGVMSIDGSLEKWSPGSPVLPARLIRVVVPAVASRSQTCIPSAGGWAGPVA